MTWGRIAHDAGDAARRHHRRLPVPDGLPRAGLHDQRAGQQHDLRLRLGRPPDEHDGRPGRRDGLRLQRRRAGDQRHRPRPQHHDLRLRRRPPADEHQRRPARGHGLRLRRQRRPADHHRRPGPRDDHQLRRDGAADADDRRPGRPVLGDLRRRRAGLAVDRRPGPRRQQRLRPLPPGIDHQLAGGGQHAGAGGQPQFLRLRRADHGRARRRRQLGLLVLRRDGPGHADHRRPGGDDAFGLRPGRRADRLAGRGGTVDLLRLQRCAAGRRR